MVLKSRQYHPRQMNRSGAFRSQLSESQSYNSATPFLMFSILRNDCHFYQLWRRPVASITTLVSPVPLAGFNKRDALPLAGNRAES